MGRTGGGLWFRLPFVTGIRRDAGLKRASEGVPRSKDNEGMTAQHLEHLEPSGLAIPLLHPAWALV